MPYIVSESWLAQHLAEARRRIKRRLLDLSWPVVLTGLRATIGRRAEEPGGVTIVIVNYNASHFLDVSLAAIARFTDRTVSIIVLDNGSVEPPLLTGRTHRLRLVRVPVNILHGPALDLGVLLSRTEFVVTLDVDAFPVSSNWLDVVLNPLLAGAQVAGGEFPQAQLTYAHPCLLALRRRQFIESRTSFREVRRSGQLLLDVGGALTLGAQGEVVRVEPSSVRGPGFIGTTYADAVYHNFYGTRLAESTNASLRELGLQATAAWDEAVSKYLSASSSASGSDSLAGDR